MLHLVMAEGWAEKAVIDVLLDSGSLLFSRDEIIDNTVFKTLAINNEVLRVLGYQYIEPIKIVRIVDKSKNMAIPREYKHKLELPYEDYVTGPEIETLYIIKMGDYTRFIQKSKGGRKKEKPSEYCKRKYRGYEKEYDFWVKAWQNDVRGLIAAIKTYRSKSQGQMKTLLDLIKPGLR